MGLWLAFASVLILPFDVANSRGSGEHFRCATHTAVAHSCSVSGGGLRVDVMWYIAYVTLAILVTFLIPFAFFYYESDTAE